MGKDGTEMTNIESSVYWKLAGEALLGNSPYLGFPKNFSSADDWAIWATLMIDKKVWTEEVIKIIVSYANSNIAQLIDIRHGKLIVVGGMLKKSPEGQDLLSEVLDAMDSNDSFFKVKDGKILTIKKDELGNMIGNYTFQN
jgi:hypothetical protein